MPAALANEGRDFTPPTHEPSFNHTPYDQYAHNLSVDPVYDYNAWYQSYVRGFAPLPRVAHPVWILDCKSCDTFLTNRGMKAVLLLHPNVSLYSSDALPINCSAYSSNPDVLRQTAARPRSDLNRTCECLTQTLCCHGCGSAIGYMIVIPCNRCTGSFTITNRATNGHRFIFYSSEVVGTERHYVPDEPGVIPYEPPGDLAVPNGFQMPHGSPEHVIGSQLLPQHGTPSVAPPGSAGNIGLAQTRHSHSHASSFSEIPFSGPTEAKELRLPRELEAGDILFWYHLSRHGEIPGVNDDPRARVPNIIAPESSRLLNFDR
ncbi:hypothetical protein AX15_006774 [Amanita polypyramis BW_CC]|nr:hypothetical protein AX15_006774 [Amanita polypyramis BW_CC]